jgi:RNA polymerase sigma-70 factor (ECF subfamily)
MRVGPSQHSDVELFERMRGEPEAARRAFEELYNRYAADVYRYCFRVVGDQALAEDLFQETFLRLYRSAADERVMTNVAAFILRIARNLCLNTKKNRHYTLLSLEQFELPAHDTGYERKEMEHLVLTALDCLPDDYREVIVLREYEGLSYAEIADVVGISVSTVGIRIFRARRKLAEILAPYIAELSE